MLLLRSSCRVSGVSDPYRRPRFLPYGVGLRTYMLAAVLILGIVVGVIGLIALVLNVN
jgi:hypothetical protein